MQQRALNVLVFRRMSRKQQRKGSCNRISLYPATKLNICNRNCKKERKEKDSLAAIVASEDKN